MKHLLLGFTLFACAWTVSADDIALYKVELIVFENLDPEAIHAEDWPADPGTPPLDNAVELSAITAAPPAEVNIAAAPIDGGAAPPVTDATAAAMVPPPPPAPTWQWLDDSALTLNAQVQKLDDSQRYKTIVHVGWIQPLDSSDHGTPVHIYDGMESTRVDNTIPPSEATVIPLHQDGGDMQSASTLAVTPESNAAAQPLNVGAPVEADSAQAPPATAQDTAETPEAQAPHILDGTFTLRRGRFLHVDVDLGYTKTVNAEEPAATIGAPDVPPQTTRYYVRMIQSRRIRNDSLHYLDHPLFGVLFTVSPYQASGTDDSEQK